MIMLPTRLVLAAVTIATFLGSAQVAAQTSFAPLLSRVPDDANALIMINAAQIRQSAYVKGVGGLQRESREQVNPHLFPPEEIQRAVLASRVGYDGFDLVPAWEVAVASTIREPSFTKIAEQRGGAMQMLGDAPSVWLPTNAYLVSFGPQLVGMVSPAERQFAALSCF